MTEDEFRALLAVEGKELNISLLTPSSLYHIAVVTNKADSEDIRYAVGKSPKQALKNIIKAYYADNR